MQTQEHRIRIPDRLFQRLHGAGLKNRRSATKEAIVAIENHLKKVSKKIANR